jgi:hypothetical protein
MAEVHMEGSWVVAWELTHTRLGMKRIYFITDIYSQ